MRGTSTHTGQDPFPDPAHPEVIVHALGRSIRGLVLHPEEVAAAVEGEPDGEKAQGEAVVEEEDTRATRAIAVMMIGAGAGVVAVKEGEEDVSDADVRTGDISASAFGMTWEKRHGKKTCITNF